MSIDVQIQYCVPCGHLPRAQDIQKTILERFGERIDGVKLKTGNSGVFKIWAGQELIYEKPQEFDLDKVVEDIEARL